MATRFKFTALHNGEVVGIIEDGAIETSPARNDEAVFFYGMAGRRHALPVSPAYDREWRARMAANILNEAFRPADYLAKAPLWLPIP
jgi:hypothetical protein